MKIIVNPDNEVVKTVRQALKDNDGYCPCKVLHIADNKCMCKDFREQGEGECHCGLYIKINGQVGKRLKPSVCKTDTVGFVGSNPTLSTTWACSSKVRTHDC